MTIKKTKFSNKVTPMEKLITAICIFLLGLGAGFYFDEDEVIDNSTQQMNVILNKMEKQLKEGFFYRAGQECADMGGVLNFLYSSRYCKVSEIVKGTKAETTYRLEDNKWELDQTEY